MSIEFTDLLDDYQIPYYAGKGASAKSRDGWINLKCPFCDRDPYLGYCEEYRYFSCWNCGRHPAWEVISLLTGLTDRECFAIVGKLPRNDFRIVRKAGKYKQPDGVDSLTSAHRKYLESRGFDPDQIITTWEVKGISGYGLPHLRWRLFIPIHLHGELVSWTTRTIQKDREPRYLSARDEESSVRIDDLIYGMDHVRNVVILVEGPLDVWAIGPGAVCTLGLHISEARLEQLSRVPIKYVCFDAEKEAQKKARKLCNDLSVYDGSVTNILLDSAKDPAGTDQTEINKLRKLLW
jgi:hypothetical protein